jgi:hypothetical protein
VVDHHIHPEILGWRPAVSHLHKFTALILMQLSPEIPATIITISDAHLHELLIDGMSLTPDHGACAIVINSRCDLVVVTTALREFEKELIRQVMIVMMVVMKIPMSMRLRSGCRKCRSSGSIWARAHGAGLDVT